MKRTLLKSVSLLVCCHFLLTSGCASIVSGGLQTVPISSTPSAAKLEITDMDSGQTIFSTNTPFSASLKRSSGFFNKADYRIKVSKEGYEPQELSLQAGLNGWYWGNILFGGLIGILIVDPATGAMWSLDETPINISLIELPKVDPVALMSGPQATPPAPVVVPKAKAPYSEIITY